MAELQNLTPSVLRVTSSMSPSGVFEAVTVYHCSLPAPNPRAGKGLVTLERFLGCTDA